MGVKTGNKKPEIIDAMISGFLKNPAASYSPTQLPGQYHRR